MLQFHNVKNTAGHLLSRQSNGALCLEASTKTPITAACTAASDTPMLLEAGAQNIHFGSPESGSELIGLRAVAEGSTTLLRHGIEGPFLRIVKGRILADANQSRAAPFQLVPGPPPAAGSPLHKLPPRAKFTPEGLAEMLATGDAGLMPVIQALLPQFNAMDARAAWAITPPTPARDIFHHIIRDHSRTQLHPFNGYTADVLRPMIDSLGWSIGDKTYGTPRVMEAGRGRLSIGRYCSMADPLIILGNHNIRSASSYPFVDLWVEWPGTLPDMSDHSAEDVTIGNDVWIGANVTILPGVEIGDGAIIGAGCVVRGKVPPYAICLGNPHSIVAKRFDNESISRLLELRWWDWPDAKIDRHLPLLLAPAIKAFLDKAEAG